MYLLLVFLGQNTRQNGLKEWIVYLASLFEGTGHHGRGLGMLETPRPGSREQGIPVFN